MLVGLAAAQRRATPGTEHLLHVLGLVEPRGAADIAYWARAELAALGTRRPGADRCPSGRTSSEWRVACLAVEARTTGRSRSGCS